MVTGRWNCDLFGQCRHHTAKAADGLPGGAERHGHHDQPGAGDLWSRGPGLPHVAGLREAAAALFQVDQPEQVVLTFNATHGLNLAIHSLVRPGATVLLSGYEHNAVTRPWPPSRSCACGWFRRRCSAPTFFWRPWSTS